MSNQHLNQPTAFFGGLFERLYAAGAVKLESLSAIPGVRAVFRARLADGTSRILRAYASAGAVPDWLAGCGAATNLEWLASRAATLGHLEQHGYAAPRVIRTRAGELVGEAGGWCTLATSFVAGEVIRATPQSLRQLGAALGCLHQVPLDLAGSHPPGRSWWHPETAIPAILDQYAAVVAGLPERWQPTVDACCAALRTIQAHAELPRAIVHGDAWVGNAVQASQDAVTLIDWEPSGLGLAVLDLGRLLLYGHYDADANLAQPIQPSAWRIEAIMEGYCRQRPLTAAERALLANAIRYGVACGAASHFTSQSQAGWRDRAPERLVRRQHWLAISDEIAAIARQRMLSL